ncbi:hypothetical protein [Lactococcus fujiensis]|uniref:hypothetical protein n=1 Tax=Lactococcus fujiensis TaxID=610251 RepID=UPI000A507E70|nr:hypothetical protein [Lactococcus fujiensis]
MRKTKIVVPIMPHTLEELESLDPDLFAKTDLIEWRVDYMKKSQIEVAADLIKKKILFISSFIYCKNC